MPELPTLLLPFLNGVKPLECDTKEECIQYLDAGYKYCIRRQTLTFRIGQETKFHLPREGDILTDFNCTAPFHIELGGLPYRQLNRIVLLCLPFQNVTVVVDGDTNESAEEIIFTHTIHYLNDGARRAILNEKAIFDGPVFYMGGMAAYRPSA